MFHHEYTGEKLLGTCFAYKNINTMITAAHCLVGIMEFSRVHVGIPAEVQNNHPLPNRRTIRKALMIYRHLDFDIAVLKIQEEYCDGPLTQPFFHNIFGVNSCDGKTVSFRGYTNDRLEDQGRIIARSKTGAITRNYLTDATNPRPLMDIEARIEHKNSGAPVILDEMNTGTPFGIVVTFKGTSTSDREDSEGEILLLEPFKTSLNKVATDNVTQLDGRWERVL